MEGEGQNVEMGISADEVNNNTCEGEQAVGLPGKSFKILFQNFVQRTTVLPDSQSPASNSFH